jgi:hypothetical protein|tara:strand:+ start:25576 stop:26184 length:609 start_codon:yes stop_codon:yes gene_type:complete
VDLQKTIESILIDSNDQRIEQETLGRPIPKESEQVSSSLSIKSSHVSEEDVEEASGVKSPKDDPTMGVVGDFAIDSNEIFECEHGELDRLRTFLVNPAWEQKINRMIDTHICNAIRKASDGISKKDFSLKLIDHRNIEVSFDENKIIVSPLSGDFITGEEVIYVDYHDLQVDFLILRKKESGLEDTTKHYKVLLNNELVPFS